jgi:phosphoglycolate phosphatase
MKNDAIIFDVDGTLWDACAASARGWNEGLKSVHEPRRLTAGDIASVAGHPYQRCIEILLPGMLERHPDLFDLFNEHERRFVEREGGAVYEGVVEGIKVLSTKFVLFLISNCQDWYLGTFLKFCKIEEYLRDADCHGRSSLPKDKMIQKIQKNYSLENPVYVGDTAGDQQAAKLAKVDFVHVSYGFGEPTPPCLAVPSFGRLVEHFMGV